MEDGFLTLHTTLAPEALKEKLQRWEPWLARFDFDNGVSTRDCAKLTPFNERPLDKVALFASAVPFAELAGGRLLDIGSNAGHNSIHAAVKYRFSTIGIDIKSRHIEVSRFLAGLAAASCEFELASAETFSRPREFDVVLHFGTLYHLPNPLLSLRQSLENLKPGGYLALETQVYDIRRIPTFVISCTCRITILATSGR
jgi:2-polyprenyl-3-methyl-5-hydroxy-6-metoxy-1,4-benzoquinol methylase